MPPEPCTRRDGTRRKRYPNEAAAKFKADWDAMRTGELRYPILCAACGGWHVAGPWTDDYPRPHRREEPQRQRHRGAG